jgi:hypothetical protein
MTQEEILLTELIKLQSQVYEDPAEIVKLSIKAIQFYGSMKYDEGRTQERDDDSLWLL